MSHISKIELEINSLEDLKLACKRLGFTFIQNQQTYRWFGRFIGDSLLPEGINIEDLGKCDHAIQVSDCLYEIGIVKRGTKYILLWDSWHAGGLEQKIGKDCGILKQSYTIEKIIREAKRKKYQVKEIKQDQSVRLVLRI